MFRKCCGHANLDAFDGALPAARNHLRRLLLGERKKNPEIKTRARAESGTEASRRAGPLTNGQPHHLTGHCTRFRSHSTR
jgi:hypothetical protein